MVYKLKQYDKTLIEFEIVSNHLEGVECRIVSVDKESEYLLPYGLTVSEMEFYHGLNIGYCPRIEIRRTDLFTLRFIRK